jgi:hypothetical protein
MVDGVEATLDEWSRVAGMSNAQLDEELRRKRRKR